MLAPNASLCDSCPRNGSRPERLQLTALARLATTQPDEATCFLAQGLVCHGPATRQGCQPGCVEANMPCRGCFGPLDGVVDGGAAMLSAFASLFAGRRGRRSGPWRGACPDPAGTFWRYGLAAALLPRRLPEGLAMTRRITIDPITRLEGHGKVEILLDEQGNAQHAFLQVPELRGFEQFCVGRPAEEMPQLTAHVCGVCPAAHHLASVRALDALYHRLADIITKAKLG